LVSRHVHDRRFNGAVLFLLLSLPACGSLQKATTPVERSPATPAIGEVPDAILLDVIRRAVRPLEPQGDRGAVPGSRAPERRSGGKLSQGWIHRRPAVPYSKEPTMTSIMDMVQQHLGDNGVDQLTQHLGVDKGTAQAAIAAAIPMLVNAAQNQTAQPGGAPSAGGLAGAAGGLLGNLFGGNHAEAAQQVSKQSGLDLHQAEKALMFLAPLVLAKFMNQRQPAATGAPTAPAGGVGQPAAPQASDQSSGLGKVVDAVEKIFHRGG
jgi:hypothetical protein